MTLLILDGGLAKWEGRRRPLATGKEALRHRHFTVWADDTHVRSLDQMKANLDSHAEQVVDARSPRALPAKSPIRGPRRMPAISRARTNIPYKLLFNDDGSWKQGDALKAVFDEAGVDLAKPLVTTCGSGITAAVLAFGAHLLGNNAALYDGSWSEWAPIARRQRPWARREQTHHERPFVSDGGRPARCDASRRRRATARMDAGHRQPAGVARIDDPV